MERFTISLDPELAAAFDQLIAARGYQTRSEAVRDLIRRSLDVASLAAEHTPWCVANVSYVYDRNDAPVTRRVQTLQHDHHDLVVASHHTPLDHSHGVETVTLRGETAAVRALADQMVAIRGVRHGSISLVPLHKAATVHSHTGIEGHAHRHIHYSPVH